MRHSNISKILGISIASLSLATLAAVVPASAQTTTGSDTTTAPADTTTNRPLTDGNYQDGDWGLLGLLGLFGLLGRKSRRADETVTYTDPNVAGTSGRSNY